jgi:hypothetical protein
MAAFQSLIKDIGISECPNFAPSLNGIRSLLPLCQYTNDEFRLIKSASFGVEGDCRYFCKLDLTVARSLPHLVRSWTLTLRTLRCFANFASDQDGGNAQSRRGVRNAQ